MEIADLTQLHWHEALDRAGLSVAHFEEDILEHPAIRQTPELKAMADKIGDLLADLYGAVDGYYERAHP